MFILLSISFVSAAQNDTQITDDEILTVTEENLQTEEIDEIKSKSNAENNLTSDVGTYTELEQVFLTNDKFTFEKDYAAHQGDGIINIKRSIEIDGNGHTIDAGNFTGIFQADSSQSNGINVIIKNLILKSGRKEQNNAIGGAILVKNVKNVHFNIINCTFINNRAKSYGGAIYFSSDGGAIEISNSKFTTNNANGDGGTIYLDGECSGIRNSIFENNWAFNSDGGAIYIDSGNKNGVVIENCKFNKNQVIVDSSGRLGGAICNKGKGNLRILNSDFDSNQIIGLKPGYDDGKFSDKKGGAVYSENKLELGGCNFNNNYAHDCGGAVYADVLVWLEQPSKFTNNHVYNGNSIVANKGGAIYASSFQNTAKGLIFINNYGYYGGAIYINNKNDVTFESCYFEDNKALNPFSSQGSGAAIYIDSSGSKVSLVNNIFVNNKATSDSAVFNCGSYGTIANNWWGNNNPDFDNAKYLVEWHRFKSNEVIKDEKYLRATATSARLYASPAYPAEFTVYFVNNKGENFTGKLTNLNMDISSTGWGQFIKRSVGYNNATVIFRPTIKFGAVITVTINQEEISVGITRVGDFTLLQREIDAANGTLNLTRNYKYTNKELEKMTDGIVINKPITINGNGHRLEAISETRIFNIQSDNVTINNVIFNDGNNAKSGGAITVNGKNIKIMNSIFNDNHVSGTGGAINIDGGSDIKIIGCTFTRNAAYHSEGGGAICINASNVKIEKSVFNDNSGPKSGAIDIKAENVIIDSCEFRHNHANAKECGGAITNSAKNVEIKNSVFLENSAKLEKIDYEIKNDSITFTLIGTENYMNAIFSTNNITFSNVTYWDGATTTSNNPPCSTFEKGINMGIDIIDDKKKIIKQIGLKTDNEGRASYNYSDLSAGSYTFKAYHGLDGYYRPIETTGAFNVSGTKKTYPSEVKINLENGTEFSFGKHNITFEVTNRTIVEVVITNSDFTQVLYDNVTNLNYVTVDLPASDEYYNIIVFNQGNETYDPTSDEKAFKILKLNSTVKINPITNLNYTDSVTITFTGDGASYNVTVYDENSTSIFSQIIAEHSVEIPDILSPGRYWVTVINLGDENRTQSTDSIKFNISKKNNEIKVTVANATYGEGVQVNITAQIDGNYIVCINNTEIIFNVFEGHDSEILELAAGRYTTNVTFDDPNYNNIIETHDFTVRKAQSDVTLSLGNVAFNQSTTVSIYDNFPTEYNVTLYDSGNNVIFNDLINETQFTIPALINGEYNLTIVNLGNENITGSKDSTVFDVTTDNYVEIIVYDEYYGRELLVIIFADVNGYYTVDINGTELTIEVEDGFGYNNNTELDAGEYYANVTFDNPDYNNIIENTTFIVYQAESNIQISDIENITYGEYVTVEYYDNYNATFDVVIFDENEDVIYSFKTNATTVLVSDLAAGNYTVMVTNEGNENIIGSSEFKNFTVLKATPDVNVTVGNVTFPENVVIDLISDVSGDYTIGFEGRLITVPLEANVAKHIPLTLSPSEYEINIAYEENENYTAVNITVPVTVSKQDPKFKVNVSTDDKMVNITVNVDSDATGNVEITIAGNKFYAPIKDGVAEFTNNYNPGIYVANVTYPGNDYFESASKNAVFSISEVLPILNNTEITLEISQTDNEVLIVASVNDTATGLIQIDIGDDTVFMPVNNGAVVYDVLLPAGNYTITATYLGDDSFNPNSTSQSIEVTGLIVENTTIDLTYEIKGRDAIVNINTNVNGEVIVFVDGTKQTVKLDENGNATLNVASLSYGEHSVVVLYEGDKYHTSANNATNIFMEAFDTKFTNITVYQDSITAVLVLSTGDALVNQAVRYAIDGVEFNTTTDDEGMFAITDVSGKLVELFYDGDVSFLPTSTSIKLDIKDMEFATKFNITNGYRLKVYAVDYKAGERGAYFDVLLSDSEGNPLANQVVYFAINGWVHIKETDEKGVAHLQINLQDANYYTCAPCFLGNDTYNATFASAMLEVVKKPITISVVAKSYKATAKTKKYTITLKTIKGSSADGKTYLSAGKKVTLKVNGKTYTAKINAKGQATFSLKLTKKGKFQAVIKFAGDKTYNAASKTVKITIK
ncbi:MAG: hypothetical protein E7Z83_00010 [Methanobrevibacter sp.]|nr:Ig-like domain repeat protein [Methanobrevibacter sp.]MBE6489234.1 hypothetical protein [Methanobrevibacter sp.]